MDIENKGTLERKTTKDAISFVGEAPIKIPGRARYAAIQMQLIEIEKRDRDIAAGYQLIINGEPVGFASWQRSERSGNLYVRGQATNGMGSKFWFIFYPNYDDAKELISFDIKNTDNSIDKAAQKVAAQRAAQSAGDMAFA